jgi:hypothetical protein
MCISARFDREHEEPLLEEPMLEGGGIGNAIEEGFNRSRIWEPLVGGFLEWGRPFFRAERWTCPQRKPRQDGWHSPASAFCPWERANHLRSW